MGGLVLHYLLVEERKKSNKKNNIHPRLGRALILQNTWGYLPPPKRAQQNIPCRQGKIIKRERIKSHHTTSERTDTFQPDASSHYRSELEENDIWSCGYNYFRCSSEAVQQRVKKSSQLQRRTVWRYKGLSSPSSSWAASGLGPNRRSVMMRVYTAAWLLGEAIYSSLVSNGKTAIYSLK